jgi:hypothetical protein
MKKGFFLNIDIMIAIVVAFILILTFSFNLLRGQEDPFANVYLSKVSNDILVVLNRNRTLETLNAATINSSLVAVLPKNLAARLSIIVYCNPEGTCKVSDKYVNIVYPSGAVEGDSVISKIGFITFENKKIKYYCLAELGVWLR